MQKIAVIGAGSMGSGIAQIAATAGHQTVVWDLSEGALEKAQANLERILARLVEKGRMDQSTKEQVQARITWASDLEQVKGSDLVVEAIVENLDIKKDLFAKLEALLGQDAILATNTSSLSVSAIGSALQRPERIVGIHFFNPAPLMPLVEIVPAVQTAEEVVTASRELIDSWGKVTVLAKDTPGFIVNRIARPFYGEALRIYEEGFAGVPSGQQGFATIDWAMTELGGFRMGPFTLMDLIGNDVNYAVTESVFEAFYYDPRYKPSFTQKRHSEAGYHGRKTGRGYYDYSENAAKVEPLRDEDMGRKVLERILAMLINEAADALLWKIATPKDIDLAMTKGVNYPKGLLAWCDEWGADKVLSILEGLHAIYGEDRYRPSPVLREMVRNDERFLESSVIA